MSDSEPLSPPPPVPKAPETLGQILRNARLAQDLTVEQLSTELRIEAKQLNALEQNRFEQIGVPVFIKGYLKQYGLRLGLDVSDLLALYHKQTTLADIEIQPRRTIKLRDERQITSWILAAIVLLTLVVGLAVWWWSGGSFSTAWGTRSTPRNCDVPGRRSRRAGDAAGRRAGRGPARTDSAARGPARRGPAARGTRWAASGGRCIAGRRGLPSARRRRRRRGSARRDDSARAHLRAGELGRNHRRARRTPAVRLERRGPQRHRARRAAVRGRARQCRFRAADGRRRALRDSARPAKATSRASPSTRPRIDAAMAELIQPVKGMNDVLADQAPWWNRARVRRRTSCSRATAISACACPSSSARSSSAARSAS